jgi:hypothetical protein
MASKTASAPAGNSNARDYDIYEVRFHGMYHTQEKGVHKPYEFIINMDEKAKKQGFLHTFVRQVLTDPGFQRELRKKYPDWKRHRTHHEDGAVIIKPDGTRVPVQELGLMNYKQLAAYIRSKDIGIQTDLFPTAPELKQAIVDYRDNREAFLKNQQMKADKIGMKLEVAASLRDLNDWSTINIEQDNSAVKNDPIRNAPAEAKDLNDADELEDLLNTV